MTVMFLHTAYAPPYTCQEQLPTPLTLRKEFRCHGATSAALWYKCSESASRFHLREETIHGAQTNGHTDKWDSPAPRHTFKYAVKKNKESPEDERSRSGSGVPSSPDSWLDKRLTPPQLSGASLHSSFPEESVHDDTISFGVSCLSS